MKNQNILNSTVIGHRIYVSGWSPKNKYFDKLATSISECLVKTKVNIRWRHIVPADTIRQNINPSIGLDYLVDKIEVEL